MTDTELEKIINCGAKMPIEDAHILDDTAREIKAKTILEVGSYDGGSAIILGKIAQENNGEMFCIEPQVRQKFVRNMFDFGLSDTVSVVQGLSPWIDVGWLFNKTIDYLFIDGAHFFRWVLTDYHFFEPFVKIGGCIAFHDCREERSNEIWAAIQCILLTDDLTEIKRSPGKDGKCGIMVFRKNSPSGHKKQYMRATFTHDVARRKVNNG